MQENKIAKVVAVNLKVRVIVPEDMDPDVDYEEFNKIVAARVANRLKEEGPLYIGEHIDDHNDDTLNPYDAEHDA